MRAVMVIGFASRKRNEEPQVLYVGHDADKAQAVHKNPPAGIARTEYVRNPKGRRLVHDPEREGAPGASGEAPKRRARKKAQGEGSVSDGAETGAVPGGADDASACDDASAPQGEPGPEAGEGENGGGD